MSKRSSIVLASCLISGAAYAGPPATYGYVTPTTVRLTFHTVTLIQAGSTPNDERDVNVLDGSFTSDFNRADPDLEPSPFGDVDIPEGRYVAIKITYDASWLVKLDGTIYQGQPIGGAIDGTTAYYTTGADGLSPNSISTSVSPGTSATFVTLASPNSLAVTTTIFASPICVSADGKGSDCEAGDLILGPADPPDINILLDLYHAVSIDPTMMSLASGGTYAYATLGRPGAAAHYTATNALGYYADASLLFTSDARLQFAAVAADFSDPQGQLAGVVTGVNVAPVTAAPPGEFRPVQGSMMIADAEFATGKASFPAGGCTDTCFSLGLITLDGFTATAGQTASMSCSSDVTGALGYTYVGGDCTPVGNFTMPTTGSTPFTIARVVDPSGVLGNCSSTSPGFLHGATCAAASTTDGYP